MKVASNGLLESCSRNFQPLGMMNAIVSTERIHSSKACVVLQNMLQRIKEDGCFAQDIADDNVEFSVLEKLFSEK